MISSSDAILPNSPKIALAERQDTFFAWWSEHLNARERRIITPRYRSSSTHEINSPDSVHKTAHVLLCLWPIRRQQLFLRPYQADQAHSQSLLTASEAGLLLVLYRSKISSPYRTINEPINDGASRGQNMWGGQTWRAGVWRRSDPLHPSPVKTRRICINFGSDL